MFIFSAFVGCRVSRVIFCVHPCSPAGFLIVCFLIVAVAYFVVHVHFLVYHAKRAMFAGVFFVSSLSTCFAFFPSSCFFPHVIFCSARSRAFILRCLLLTVVSFFAILPSMGLGNAHTNVVVSCIDNCMVAHWGNTLFSSCAIS